MANEQPDTHREKLVALCRDIAQSNGTTEWTDIDCWLFGNLAAELAYMTLISHGRKPQEARVVLPLDGSTRNSYTQLLSTTGNISSTSELSAPREHPIPMPRLALPL